MQPTQQPSHRPLEFLPASEGLWAAAPGPLSHGAMCRFYSDPRTRDVAEERRIEMCSRACLPPHFCSRTREQCRSPTGNILCSALPGSALFPRAELTVAPAGPGPRPKVAEGEGPRRPHTWLAGKHSFSSSSVRDRLCPTRAPLAGSYHTRSGNSPAQFPTHEIQT